MNRTAPGRGTVRLAFVRLPATTRRPAPPVVFLSGGPGLSGIRMGRGRLFALFDALRAHGDVILLDQRGAGESTPSLACADPLTLAFERAHTRAEVLHAAIASTRRCAERLLRDGVDLAAFHSGESADDVADLARTLGSERIALLGWSYGTHLAFAVMRRHAGLVARAVLAGPEGPDQTYKLPSRSERQLEAIAQRARSAWPGAPDLLASMRTILEAIEREPRVVALATADGGTRPAVIGRFDLEWILAEGIADTRALARWPRWFADMARGDFDAIANDPLFRSYFEELRTGLNRSLTRVCMDCASGASATRRRRIEDEARATLLGRTIDFPLPEICDAVGVPDLGDEFRAPLFSDTEVLFVTGTLDARTPAENAADLAPGFARHRHLVIEDAGHGDLLTPPQVHDEIVRFFESAEIANERVRATPLRFEAPRPVLIYDGACAFCRGQVDRLRRRTGETVAFVPYQNAGWTAIAPADLARAVHWVGADGKVASGAEAVLRARAAGGRRSTLWWMYRRVPGFAAVAEWCYRWVAGNRGRLGGIDH